MISSRREMSREGVIGHRSFELLALCRKPGADPSGTRKLSDISTGWGRDWSGDGRVLKAGSREYAMHLTNPDSRFQRSISVIASHPVGAKRRRMTGSAKQS